MPPNIPTSWLLYWRFFVAQHQKQGGHFSARDPYTQVPCRLCQWTMVSASVRSCLVHPPLQECTAEDHDGYGSHKGNTRYRMEVRAKGVCQVLSLVKHATASQPCNGRVRAVISTLTWTWLVCCLQGSVYYIDNNVYAKNLDCYVQDSGLINACIASNDAVPRSSKKHQRARDKNGAQPPAKKTEARVAYYDDAESNATYYQLNSAWLLIGA